MIRLKLKAKKKSHDKPRRFNLKKKYVNPLTKLHFVSAWTLQLERDLDKMRRLRDAETKRLKIVVADLQKWCDRCLERRAIIYSPTFAQMLCLECENYLECAAGAEVFDRMQRKAG